MVESADSFKDDMFSVSVLIVLEAMASLYIYNGCTYLFYKVM